MKATIIICLLLATLLVVACTDDTILPTTKVFKPWPGADLSDDFGLGARGHYGAVVFSDCKGSSFFMFPDAPTSIHESIFLSDAVVMAEFVSVETGANPSSTLPRRMEFDSPGYSGVIRYTFNVLEYLKGEGDETITVEAHHLGFGDELWFHPNRAMREASEFLHLKSERWHDRPMLLFLQKAPDMFSSDYTFTDTDAGPFQQSCWDDHIYRDSRFLPDREWNVAWYPVRYQDSYRQGLGDDQEFYSTISKRWGSRDPTISLEEIKARIAEVERLIAEFADPALGAECVRKKFFIERLNWSREDIQPGVIEFKWNGRIFNTYGMKSGGGWGYGIVPVVAGDLAGIVEPGVGDHNDDPTDGYNILWSFNRGLPKGAYSSHVKFGVPTEALENDPCPTWFTGVETVEELTGRNVYEQLGIKRSGLTWVYTEVGVKRTRKDGLSVPDTAWYHEGFFDPGRDGETHGYITGVFGRLDPQPAETGGDFTITELSWSDGRVSMKITYPVGEALPSYNLFFSTRTDQWNDGVALVLPFTWSRRHSMTKIDDTWREAYEWCVPEQPWAAGDKFMLAVHEWEDVSEYFPVSGVSCDE